MAKLHLGSHRLWVARWPLPQLPLAQGQPCLCLLLVLQFARITRPGKGWKQIVYTPKHPPLQSVTRPERILHMGWKYCLLCFKSWKKFYLNAIFFSPELIMSIIFFSPVLWWSKKQNSHCRAPLCRPGDQWGCSPLPLNSLQTLVS